MTRIVLAAVFCCGTAPGQSAPADAAKTKASITGIVQEAGTGSPIADANVSISRIGVPDGQRQESRTDSQGQYSFKDLAAGRYQLSAYMLQQGTRQFGAFAAKTVTLAPGQELTSADIPVRIRGSFAGRVMDENKEPIQGVQVFLIAREYSLGSLRHVFASLAITDDQGQYTLDRVEPGRAYLLMARKVQRSLPAISEMPEDPKLRKRIPAPTYYPDSPLLEGAQALVLRPGEKRENIDFRLVRTASYCIEGILAAAGTPGALSFTIGQAKVTSGLSGNGGFFIQEPGGRTGDDGKIRICELPPGEYRLTVYRQGPEIPFFGIAPVSVVDRDVAKFTATVPPQLPVKVEIAWDGEPPEQPVDTKVVFGLSPLTRTYLQGERLTERQSIPAEFSFPGVFADEYSAAVRNVPPNLYVKSMTYGNADAMHEPLRVGSAVGNASLRIVIARDGGTVQTKVTDKDGNAIADCHVLLMPVNISSEQVLTELMITGQTDQNGAWKSNAIAPGKYLALATTMPVDKSPESIHKLWNARPHAAEIELAPNGSAQVTLSPRTLD